MMRAEPSFTAERAPMPLSRFQPATVTKLSPEVWGNGQGVKDNQARGE